MTCVVPAEWSTTAVGTEPAALGASAGWHPCQVSPKPSEEAASATSFKDLTPAIHTQSVTLAGFGQRDQTSGPQMTCEGGEKPSADSTPPGYSGPKAISLGAKSLCSRREGGRAPTQSHPATPTRRSFRWAPSLCSRRGKRGVETVPEGTARIKAQSK